MHPQPSKPQTERNRVRPPRKGAGNAPELLFLSEVAQELRISLSTVQRVIRAGELRSLRIAGKPRVSRFDLQAYLRSARSREAPAPSVTPPPPRVRDEDYLSLLGAAVLDAIGLGRAVYLASREELDREITRYLLRVRPDLARSESEAAALLEALYEAYKRAGNLHVLRTLAGVPAAANGLHPPDELDSIEEVLETAFGEEDEGDPVNAGEPSAPFRP